jgi:5-(carboxyamino)imidazole ribonucleotide synthase
MKQTILPGGTVGIMGGGQLARMLAMVARRSGYQVAVFTPEPAAPASPFANFTFVADFFDREQLLRFVDQVDVITFEFENVPVEPLRWIEDRCLMRPKLSVFQTVQNRINEKTFLAEHQIPCAAFRVIRSWEDLQQALTGNSAIGLPAVLKVSDGGYDGKGQFVIRQAAQSAEAWEAIGRQPATLEAFIDLELEISVLIARDLQGNRETFGPIENFHSQHILDWSLVPARIGRELAEPALAYAEIIAEKLDLTGLICVEYFVDRGGKVWVNEIAPRPHNSGHLTIEAAATSQFEQQLRTVCGLPVGSFQLLRPAAMANLLGDLWQDQIPRWDRIANYPATYLHLYDKTRPLPGRKMGHITSTADSAERALANVTGARSGLNPRGSAEH